MEILDRALVPRVEPTTDRLENLLLTAIQQVGVSCTKEFMAGILAEAKQSNVGDLVDRLVAALSKQIEVLALPDIELGMSLILGELYMQTAQPTFESLWVGMFDQGLVDSINAPGVRLESQPQHMLLHSAEIMERIDNGTVNHLATLLARVEDLASVWSAMFTVDDEDGTVLTQRIKIIVNSELSWVRNLCRVNLIDELRGKKVWRAGSPICKFGESCSIIGPVHPTFEYYFEDKKVIFPPGCVGCNCFLSMDGGRVPEIKSSALVVDNPNLKRSMLALDVPEEYSKLLGVKTPHITLLYFGKIDEEAANLIRGALEKDAPGYAPFSVFLTGFIKKLGPPDERVDAATINLTSNLQKLYDGLKTAVTNAGFAPDATWIDYTPHITLGDAGTVQPSTVKDFGGLWLVEGVRFYHGDETTFYPFRL